MKKRIVKSFAFALSGLMIMSSVAPTFAYDLDEKGNSVEEVEYQNTEDEDYTNQTNVFAEIGSEYKVTIPKVIVLSGVTKSADYYVKVEGDIAGYETVNVVPDKNVVLHTSNKADETGTITQDKTSWKVSDFDVNANGTVTADGLTAGKWSGVFNFNINMESNEDNNTNNPTQTNTEKKLTLDVNELAMDAGSSHKVKAYYDGKEVTNEIDWSSNNDKITVDKGVVMTSATAQVGDTATITASMSDDTSGLVAALDKMGIIAVASAEDGNDSVSFKVTIVEINFDDSEGAEIDDISILPGEHKSIKAKIVPETTGTVVWSCTAPSGVTLQKKGNDVTIYVANDMPSGRTYDIVAVYNDYAKTIKLNIASTAKDNLSVSIEDGDTLTVGDVKTVNVATTDGSTPSNVTITSSDENVAKIVDGKIEAVGAGEATITISANGSVTKTIDIVIEESEGPLPKPGTKLINMSFAQIQAIAREGKTAEYGIELGDTIKINDDIEAAVVGIGDNYIEFCTVQNIIEAASQTDTQVTLNIANILTQPAKAIQRSSSTSSFYQYPQINYGNKSSSAKLSYVNSDIKKHIEDWFDEQSDEFKSVVKDTNREYEVETVSYDKGGNSYKITLSGTITDTEKIYMPVESEAKNIATIFNEKNRNYYTATPSPTKYGEAEAHYYSYGRFLYTKLLNNNNIISTTYIGNNVMNVVAMFRIG